MHLAEKEIPGPDLNKHSVVEDQPGTGAAAAAATGTVTAILLAISFSHLLNDTIQSLMPAIYPFLKDSFQLSYTQIGLITLTFQLTASLLQPVVGLYTDRRPKPFSLAIGMGFSLAGLVLLSLASTLCGDSPGGGAGRARLRRVPSGILSRRAHGVGRPLRPRPIDISGRRQHRLGARTARRRLHRHPRRPRLDRLVLAGGAPRHPGAVASRPLVQAADRPPSRRRQGETRQPARPFVSAA